MNFAQENFRRGILLSAIPSNELGIDLAGADPGALSTRPMVFEPQRPVARLVRRHPVRVLDSPDTPFEGRLIDEAQQGGRPVLMNDLEDFDVAQTFRAPARDRESAAKRLLQQYWPLADIVQGLPDFR